MDATLAHRAGVASRCGGFDPHHESEVLLVALCLLVGGHRGTRAAQMPDSAHQPATPVVTATGGHDARSDR